MVIYTINNI